MAGMFDFKSAEQILAERQEKTRQNTLGLIKSSQQGMKSSEKAASNLGAMLTNLVISQFGGKSEKEQLKDTRDMGVTIEEMQKVAGDNLQNPSYGANVFKQAQAEEQRRMGLLPQEMQEAIGEERQAKQLEQAFQNVDMNDPKQTAELVKLAIASGDTEAVSLAVNFNKNALEASKGKAPDTKLGKLLAERAERAAKNPDDPNLAAYDSAIKAESAGKPGTQVNISNIDESEDAKQRAKLSSTAYSKALEKGDAAADTLYRIDVMRNIDFKPGNFEETKFKIANALQKFGVDLPDSFADISTGKALMSMSEQMVNSILMAATGVQTEGDAQRARKVIASLGDTPESFQFKLNMMEGVALRERARADFLREKVVGQGMSSAKADLEWRRWMNETPQMSNSLENEETGLPLLYHEFVRDAKQSNPELTPDEINKKWRSHHGGK